MIIEHSTIGSFIRRNITPRATLYSLHFVTDDWIEIEKRKTINSIIQHLFNFHKDQC